MTQKVSRFDEGVRVGDGLTVRLAVGVRVAVVVDDAVTVRLSVGTTVGVSGSGVMVAAGVVGGRIEGVDVREAGTGENTIDRRASRIRTPIRIGTPYLRSVAGRKGFAVSMGRSPV